MTSPVCNLDHKCPIFNNKLLNNKSTEEAYKNMYCKNGYENYSLCKRFQVNDKVGKCADFVMPNSFLSVNEIIERMELNEIEQLQDF